MGEPGPEGVLALEGSWPWALVLGLNEGVSTWRSLDLRGYRPWGLVLGLTQGVLTCGTAGPGGVLVLGVLALGLTLGGVLALRVVQPWWSWNERGLVFVRSWPRSGVKPWDSTLRGSWPG